MSKRPNKRQSRRKQQNGANAVYVSKPAPMLSLKKQSIRKVIGYTFSPVASATGAISFTIDLGASLYSESEYTSMTTVFQRVCVSRASFEFCPIMKFYLTGAVSTVATVSASYSPTSAVSITSYDLAVDSQIAALFTTDERSTLSFKPEVDLALKGPVNYNYFSVSGRLGYLKFYAPSGAFANNSSLTFFIVARYWTVWSYGD